MYHREHAQEAFLVLEGECTLIVEGEERTLRQWDFFYCAPETEHIIVRAFKLLDYTIGGPDFNPTAAANAHAASPAGREPEVRGLKRSIRASCSPTWRPCWRSL